MAKFLNKAWNAEARRFEDVAEYYQEDVPGLPVGRCGSAGDERCFPQLPGDLIDDPPSPPQAREAKRPDDEGRADDDPRAERVHQAIQGFTQAMRQAYRDAYKKHIKDVLKAIEEEYPGVRLGMLVRDKPAGYPRVRYVFVRPTKARESLPETQ